MNLRSLQVRLTGLAFVGIVLFLVGAAGVLQVLFTDNVERTARLDMEAAVSWLAANIIAEDEAPRLAAQPADPRYDTPLGGRYWQIEDLDNGSVSRSRSLWDYTIASVPDNGVYLQTMSEGRQLILFSRRLEMETAAGVRTFVVTMGQDYEPIAAMIGSFMFELGKLFVLLGALILLAAWTLIRFGMRPIRTAQKAVEVVRRGEAARLSGPFPTELLPLVDEVNQLLAVRDETTEVARKRAGDLAHGLKTPLAALYGVAERLRQRGDDSEADLVQELSFEMSERVDYQLRLSTLRMRTDRHATRAQLDTAILRTMAVLKKTHQGEWLLWETDLESDCWVDIDRQDLMELIGTTLENAVKWASTRVVVRTARKADMVEIEILDDGPGVPNDRLAELGIRGLRLDEARPGTGLGLSIASEVVKVNGGSIHFSQSRLGGLGVTISLRPFDGTKAAIAKD